MQQFGALFNACQEPRTLKELVVEIDCGAHTVLPRLGMHETYINWCRI